MTIGRSNPVTGKHRRAVGVFPSRRDAEHALYELRDSGFPMDRVSVITRDDVRGDEIAGADVHDSVEERNAATRVDNKADDGAKTGAVAGGALGGVTGLLVGLGTLAIPGIGPIMLAGAAATAIATTLAGTAIGAAAGGLIGGLIGLGIPEERAKVYGDRVARGEYLVIVDGTDEELARAEQILQHRGIEEYGVYDAPGVGHVGHDHDRFDRDHRAVGVFHNRRDAEMAIADLQSAGFPLNQISLIARDFGNRDPFRGADLRDRFDAMRYHIPVEEAKLYNDRIERGDYVVVVHGSEPEVRQAEAILNRRGIQHWRMFAPMAAGATTMGSHTPGTHVVSDRVVDDRHDLDRDHRAVGVFHNRRDAEMAIADLQSAGFPLNQISLIARDFGNRDPFRGADLRDRFDAMRYHIPVEEAKLYNDRIERGDYVVVVHGSEPEVRQAGAILSRRGIQNWRMFTPMAAGAAMGGLHDQPMMGAHTPGTHVVSDRDRSHEYKRAIGVFEHRRDAEAALTDLRNSGFPMERVSIIGKDAGPNSQVAGVDMDRHAGNKADEGAKTGAATGAALGGLGGLLVGLGTLAIPGVGPVLLGGAAATALATALSGGAIGAAAGGIVGGLVGLGIPEDRARVYNDYLNRGDYLVMVDGMRDDVHRAEGILKRHGIREWGVYDASDVDTRSDIGVGHPNPTVTRTDRTPLL